MAHGACPTCGCALEECIRDQACPGEIGRFCRPAPSWKRAVEAITASRPATRRSGGVTFIPGDWVRVKEGHDLAGAAGVIVTVERNTQPVLVKFRQLNGTEIRIPLGRVEFVGFRGDAPDVL